MPIGPFDFQVSIDMVPVPQLRKFAVTRLHCLFMKAVRPIASRDRVLAYTRSKYTGIRGSMIAARSTLMGCAL